MNRTTPYQRSAARCRELAAQAESAEERKLLLKLAASWDWISRDGEAPGAARRVAPPRKPQRRRAL